MIIGSKIGTRFTNASLKTCRIDDTNKTAIGYAKQLIAGEIDGLILRGPVGTGKTHIMLAALNDIQAAHESQYVVDDSGMESYTPFHEYVYWKAPEFASEIRKSVRNETADPTGYAMRAEVLFIDDLGTEYEKVGSDFIWTAFQAIFDYRWENMLPIMVTTNMAAPELAKRYGDRVLSRWRGSCKMLALSGDDRRKEAK